MDWHTSILLPTHFHLYRESIVAQLKHRPEGPTAHGSTRDHFRIVALHIPKFQRDNNPDHQYSNCAITLLRSTFYNSTKLSVLYCDTRLGYALHDDDIWEEKLIPDQVQSCGRFIVTCVDQEDEWDPEKLILKLLRQGYGGAVVDQSFESRHDSFQDTIREARVFHINEPFSVSPEILTRDLGGESSVIDFASTHTSHGAVPSQPKHGMTEPSSYFHQRISQAPMSNFSSPTSFMTAKSPASFMAANSPASFTTALSSYTSPALGVINEHSSTAKITTIREEEPHEPVLPTPFRQLRNDYYQGLHQQKILQPFDKELNWSGKGQHVAFMPQDIVPLLVLSHLGSSLTATVQKVLCRRIALARKTMRCSRQWKVADALREVYHLQNLRHAHIVQLVGSYLQGRNFSILLYPVADYHLGTFLEDTCDMKHFRKDDTNYTARREFLISTFNCLASAIAFIHDQTTKHMDIKPQNILVKKACSSSQKLGWHVYLADFGLSRSFASQGHSQTDGPTSRTPRYCAPEVYKYERRGRSADIFSLGCVFLEILTVCCGLSLHAFADVRRGHGDDESFHANLERVYTWIQSKIKYLHFVPGEWSILLLDEFEDLVTLFEHMIQQDPNERPPALEVLKFFSDLPPDSKFAPEGCCTLPPEPYEVYDPAQN